MSAATSRRDLAPKRTGGEVARLVSEVAPAALLGVDDAGVVLFANTAAERLFGYGRGDLLGRPISELIVSMRDIRAGMRRLRTSPLAWALARTKPRSRAADLADVADGVVDAMACRSDGTRLAVEVAESSALLPSGRPVAVAVVRDLAPRASALEHALSVDERVQAFLNTVREHAILLDSDGRVASWNSAAERITGWSADEILGKPSSILYPADEVARGRPQQLRAAAASAGRAQVEAWRVRKDGTRFYADVTLTALRDEQGDLRGFAKVTRDITARYRSEHHLRFCDQLTYVLSSSLGSYEDALRALTRLVACDLADLCILDLVDDAGELRRFDVACADPRDHAVARAVLRLAPTHAGAASPVDVARAGQARLFATVAPDVLAPGSQPAQPVGEPAPRSAVLAPLVARGHTLGVITVIRSRSAQRYDDIDLRLLQDIGQRAGLHIDNARLYKAAQDAVAERDRVLGVVAHDLRNPLNSIVVRTDVVQSTLVPRSPTGDAMRLALGRIHDTAMHMNRLIEDLLDVARMQEGGLKLEADAWSPGVLVAVAVDDARPQALAQNVLLRLDVQPGLPDVRADRDRILQVFSNLIGNALKFTPSGGEIEVRAWADGEHVHFSVRDTGVGIAPEHLPHVFDRFWQLRRADRRGAGLGLGICKWIVESHGGAIGVDSVVGRGSTFRFLLTAAPAPR